MFDLLLPADMSQNDDQRRALQHTPSQSPSKSTVDVSFCMQKPGVSAPQCDLSLASAACNSAIHWMHWLKCEPYQQMVVSICEVADQNDHLRLVRNQMIQRHW